MPLPSGTLIKVVWGGVVSTSDNWSTSCWFSVPGGTPSQADLDTATDDGRQAFLNSFWNHGTSPWRDQCAGGTKYSFSKSYVYTGGVLVRQSSKTGTPNIGNSGAPMPSYCAAVFSTRTDSFGRRYRGRMYLPASGAATDANTGLYSGLLQAHVDHLALVIGAWAGAGSPISGTPVVVSQTGGVATPITHITLDNKPDTQRGRQDQTAASQNLSATV